MMKRPRKSRSRTSRTWMTFIPTSLILATLLTGCHCNGVFPSPDTVSRWVENLEKSFRSLTSNEDDITGVFYYKEQYQKTINSEFKLIQPDGAQLVAEMADKISEVFRKNNEAVKSLQDKAEDLIRNYKYDDNLILPNVNYINVNDIDKDVSEEMLPDAHFGQDTYYKKSGVHIPIEIYEGYNPNQMSKICPTCTSVCDLCRNNLFWRQQSAYGLSNMNLIEDQDILNGLQWSSPLDEAFKENKKKYPDIYWQSFGAQEGFMRFYPAARWHTVDDLPDLYDVRRRPWYIHGSVTPKDVIVLLDTSGSMHGQSFDIMKLAAKTLLNTLGENDYVNVAQFSRNVTWVTPCLDTLVQANSRNKMLLFDGIDKLEDHQIADYGEALTFAYEEFEEFERSKIPEDGAECHRLIFIFSDGGTNFPEEVVKKYTNDSASSVTRSVRIFSYAVGPHPLPTVALKQMACSTMGSFHMITAMGAIRTKIQDYARVLTKSLVLSKEHDFQQSISAYKDFMGLGLVTTVTLPVFNTSVFSDNQTLAGVVGVDIPVRVFENFSPRAKLGPLGYSFAINQNGFLIFHPGLWMDANYLRDPEHIDMSDWEGENPTIDKLRKAMIMRPSETESIVYEKPLDMIARIPLNINREYYFVKIEGSSFTLAIAQDQGWKYLKVPNDINLDLLENLDPDQTIFANWHRCQNFSSFRKSLNLKQLLIEIKSGLCDSEEFRHLAWDAGNVQTVFNRMIRNRNSSIASSIFVTSDGGLTLFEPKESRQTYKEIGRNPYNTTMYRLAVSEQRPRLFIQNFVSRDLTPRKIEVDPEEDEDETILDWAEVENLTPTFYRVKPSVIHLISPISISLGDGQYTAGVSGAELNPDFLQNLLLETSVPRPGQLTCRDSLELVCYLIDEGGHVLASNQESSVIQPGEFLGAVEPLLMREFVEKAKIFDKTFDYNYEDLCHDSLDCCSLGVRSVIAPTLNAIVYLIQNFFRLVENVAYIIVSLVSVMFLPEESEALTEFGIRVPTGMHRCTTKTPTFFMKENIPTNEFHQRMISKCSGFGSQDSECLRDYHLYKLQSINALLVVADPKCKGCFVEPYMDGPQEVDESTDTCELPRRFRKRPEFCFSSNPQETSECSSSSHLSLSFTLLVTMILLVKFFES